MTKGTLAVRRFVGRVEDLGRLDVTLAAARAGRGGTVFVTGDPGIGKTSLVTEFADRARAAGAMVLIGRCIPRVGAALAYLPFIDAFRTLSAPPALDAAVTGSQLQLFEAVLARLDGLAGAPLALVLEDLHWADGSTLDLLAFLAYACRERPLLLIATLRRDDANPTGSVAALVEELVRARRATELVLERLGEDELAELLRALSAKPLPPALVAAIHARSEGNPFFAEELLLAAGRDDARLPAKLREALLLHIAQLRPAARAALRVVAATGRDVPYRLLAVVTPLDEASLTEALRQAVEQGVMRYDQDSATFRIRHALLAEAIYTTLLPGEREQLHRRIADALTEDASLAVTGRVEAELAHHWSGAGQPERALAASVRAARDAEAVYGLGEALGQVERAIALWPSVPAAESVAGLDLPGMLAWAAELCDLTGDITRAVAHSRRAIELTGVHADPVCLGRLHERAGTYLLHLGRQSDALVEFRRAVELVPRRPASTERARALAALANALLTPDRYAESLELCTEAIAVADAAADDVAALRAMAVRGRALCGLGRLDEGIEQLRQARERAREREIGPEVTRAGVLLSDVLNIAGQFHEAIRVATEGLALARELGLERGHGVALRVNTAEALLAIGDWARAATVLGAALRTVGSYWAQHPHLLQAQLDLGRGEFESARQHLAAAAGAAGKRFAAGHYASLLVELALWQSRPEEARSVVDAGVGQAGGPVPAGEELRLWVLGLRADVDLAQLAAAHQDTAALRRIRRHAQRLMAAVRSTVDAAAGSAADLEAWRALAEAEYARVGDQLDPQLWRAAVAAWDSLQRPYPAAYCRWRLAESLVAAAVPAAEAAVPAREAHRVARWLGAQPLRDELERLAERARLDLVGLAADPDRRVPGRPNPLGLTDRERDVLELLGRGYTNRDIGAELTISAKTASVHVSNILRKLNARTRVEAATLAHRLLPRRSVP